MPRKKDTAQKLRAKAASSEYKHVVLSLIFLKFVSDTLLPKLLSGELRIPVAEKIAERAL
ncbi:MAG: type I restriction-modification system subunit M N-terminal domain-containing protein [Pseudomonadota bacterium]